ncbi:MAG: phosphate transport system protein [Solirubrobacteraceae bacterium]|nr:phosphate transport system protein [Solirubrobacteraceae bacterium]
MVASGRGRPHFQDQMRELEASMLGALDMALAQLDCVLDAVHSRDLRLAQFVVADDARIDGRYLEVHQGVLSLLALQAPVAGDLRLVVAVLHVINNIERIGDQSANIAKLMPIAHMDGTGDNEIVERILRMGGLARVELGDARRAFAERDVAVAEALRAQDEHVNRLDREIFRLAVEAGEDPDLREWAVAMTLMSRAVERIGDNAVDIGEQAIFVATGQFRELSSPLRHADSR